MHHPVDPEGRGDSQGRPAPFDMIGAMEAPPARAALVRGRTSLAGPARPAGAPSAGRSRSARSRPASRGCRATDLLDHTSPFFAPVAAVVCLGTSYGQRLRRVAEVTIGVAVGRLRAPTSSSGIGSGWWQLTLIVALGDVDGAAARRRTAVPDPGGRAVDRDHRAGARPRRGAHPLDRRADRRRRGAGRGDRRARRRRCDARASRRRRWCARSRDLLHAASDVMVDGDVDRRWSCSRTPGRPTR